MKGTSGDTVCQAGENYPSKQAEILFSIDFLKMQASVPLCVWLFYGIVTIYIYYMVLISGHDLKVQAAALLLKLRETV